MEVAEEHCVVVRYVFGARQYYVVATSIVEALVLPRRWAGKGLIDDVLPATWKKGEV